MKLTVLVPALAGLLWAGSALAASQLEITNPYVIQLLDGEPINPQLLDKPAPSPWSPAGTRSWSPSRATTPAAAKPSWSPPSPGDQLHRRRQPATLPRLQEAPQGRGSLALFQGTERRSEDKSTGQVLKRAVRHADRGWLPADP